MSENEQYSFNSKEDENHLDSPGIAILNEKEWSYLQRYYDMSPRELQVARLVCNGFTNGDIADRLKVKPGTVKTHLRSIFGKTRTRNRISMLLKYIEKVQIIHNSNGTVNVQTSQGNNQNLGIDRIPQ
jgi:DNA-binding NarL/FixJ family response regulator